MRITAKKQIRYPLALERLYAKEIVKHTTDLMNVVRSYIPRMVRVILSMNVALDAEDEDELSYLMEDMAEEVEELPSMRPQCEDMYDKVDKHAYLELAAVFGAVFGTRPISLSQQLNLSALGTSTGATNAFEAIRNSGGISASMSNAQQLDNLKRLWVQENLDLIKSIDAETLRKIRETMADMILGNVDRAELTRDLQKGLIPVMFRKPIDKIEKREKDRAALIGRDQVGKLNGKLTQYYQQQAEIDEYEWVTAGDERVRPAHRALNGRIFQWDKSPAEGHPGQPIQCRCIASPVINTNKIGMEPKAGTYDVVGEEIEKAEDAKTFADMQKYFQDKYSLRVNNTVGQMIFKDTKPVFVGLESIFNEFPAAVSAIEEIGVARGGVMHAAYNSVRCNINFSPKYFNGSPDLKLMKMGKKTGFHPKNTYLRETGGHEFGHVLEWYMIKKNSSVGVVGRMNRHEYAKDVIKRAVDRARKTPEGKINGKAKTIRQLREEISTYALKNQGETLAEAIGDYMANGENASVLSREIWQILKGEVK